VIFAVLDVSLAVNLCRPINYICRFITFLSYYSKTAFLDCLAFTNHSYLTGIDHANQFLVFFHLNFLFDST